MRRLLALLAFVAGAASAADTLRPPLLLTGQRTDVQDLSGRWTYSKDYYRTGLTDINGWVAKSRMQRHRDLDIAAEEAKPGTAFFEFDLDRGPSYQRSSGSAAFQALGICMPGARSRSNSKKPVPGLASSAAMSTSR